jgi:hypothetical protein
MQSNLYLSYLLFFLAIPSTVWANSLQPVAPPEAVAAATRSLATSMREFSGATVTGFRPLYIPGTQRVAFYEARLVDGRTLAERGGIIVEPSGRVVQIRPGVPTVITELQRKADAKEFFVSRFGPGYYTAVDSRGQMLAEKGRMPRILADQFSQDLLKTAESYRTSREPRPHEETIPASRIRNPLNAGEAYIEMVRNYEKYFLNTPVVPTALRFDAPDIEGGGGSGEPGTPTPGGGGSTGTGATYYDAIGHNRAFAFNQVEPDHALNTAGYYSGCGPTGFTNLMLWHDRDWAPALLSGPFLDPADNKWRYSSDYITWLQLHLRDYLGTFESTAQQGATMPWNMHLGYVYNKENLAHSADAKEVWALPASAGAVALADSMIRTYGKPVLLGYRIGGSWLGLHYDIAYRMMVNGFDGRRFFLTYADPNSWVAEEDIYYASSAFDYRSVGNHYGYNRSMESGFDGWFKSNLNGGSSAVRLRQTDAQNGTAYLRLAAPQGNTQRAWKVVNLNAAGVIARSQSFWYRSTANIAGAVYIRSKAASDDSGSFPAGSILKVVQLPPAATWTEIKITIPTTASYTMELMMPAALGQNASMDFDNFSVWSSYKQQPEPKQPCTPKYPDGCELEF